MDPTMHAFATLLFVASFWWLWRGARYLGERPGGALDRSVCRRRHSSR